ncbi:MAG: hypothetical protein KDD62_07350, partial [Bdellovibrionales bacterium]|nr:hypothetical protein [Bdellovibrionales bacterium]
MDSKNPNILFVEDDKALLTRLMKGARLRSPDLNCHGAATDAEALLMAKKLLPEVIVLDLTLDPARGPESGLRLIPKFFEISESTRV